MNNSTNLVVRDWYYLAYIESITAICIGSIGILLNLFICWISFLNRRSQQSITLYITSLAITDLFNSILVVSRYTLQWFKIEYEDFRLPVSDQSYLCKVWTFFVVVTLNSSFLILAAIGMERHRAIMQPLRPAISIKKTIIIILSLWQVAFVMAVIVMFAHKPSFELDIYLCESRSDDIFSTFVIALDAIACNIIPCIILLFCYIRIAIKLCSTKPPVDSSRYRNQIMKKYRNRYRKTIIIVLVTIISIFSSLPFVITFVTLTFGRRFDPYYELKLNKIFWMFYQFSWIISLSSSIINPLLYSFCSQNFKKTILLLLYTTYRYLNVKFKF